MKVTFHGGRELEKALGELPRLATRKELVRKILLASLGPFVTRVRALAPRQDSYGGKMPQLSESYVAGRSSKLSKRQRSMIRREGRYDVVVHAGTADPAGVQQEFGNRRHRAQPHARIAWMQTREEVFRRVAEGMRKEVARAVARARRKAARSAKSRS
ncbi:hypothetical protein [Mangrovicoccus sp. HB161399]|uniref:hypothetical protein n=1 Tax=Mangrovicoccus sp. HB161399 TaxID=2720392 RepID=UPI00155327E7|nr:hypothetical protein [Mangrovicoccus sp. HB161399]